MSTNSECMFVEVEPCAWYYVLEEYDAPKNSWDWREHAAAYGPFPTMETAYRHLHDNHANPGGYWSTAYDPENPYKPDEVMTRRIESAKKRRW